MPLDRHAQLRAAANLPRIGRIARRVRRLLIAHGRMTTPELMRQVYGSPTKHWHYERVREAARKFAEPVRRVARPGCPVLWRLKD
jgi:hypothetical protein